MQAWCTLSRCETADPDSLSLDRAKFAEIKSTEHIKISNDYVCKTNSEYVPNVELGSLPRPHETIEQETIVDDKDEPQQQQGRSMAAALAVAASTPTTTKDGVSMEEESRKREPTSKS